MKKKNLSHSDRLAIAAGKQQDATDLFNLAATRLESAREEQLAIADEIEDEIQRLDQMRFNALGDAERAARSAEKIRALTA